MSVLTTMDAFSPNLVFLVGGLAASVVLFLHLAALILFPAVVYASCAVLGDFLARRSRMGDSASSDNRDEGSGQ